MKLTPRELQVANLVAQGTTNYAISLGLRISVYTVRQHMKSIFKKTGAENRTHLAVMIVKGALNEHE